MKELIKLIKSKFNDCEISEVKRKRMDVNIYVPDNKIEQKAKEADEFCDDINEKFSHIDLTVRFVISDIKNK